MKPLKLCFAAHVGGAVVARPLDAQLTLILIHLQATQFVTTCAPHRTTPRAMHLQGSERRRASSHLPEDLACRHAT